MEHVIMPGVIIFIVAAIIGLALGIADKFLKVEVDERLQQLLDMLPGYNCGACGHPGCGGFAEAILEKKGLLKECTPLKGDAAAEIEKFLSTSE